LHWCAGLHYALSVTNKLFIEEVKAGKRVAWRKFRAAWREGSATEAAKRLGIGRRTAFNFLADVPGLREFCEGEK
jgi:hypothetical protein